MENTNPYEIRGLIENSLKSHVVDAWEIFISRSKELSVEVKNGEVDSLHSADTWGMGLRVLKDKRLGFSFTFDMTEKSFEGVVDNAFNSTKCIEPDSAFCFSAPHSTIPELKILDQDGIDLPLSEKIENVILLEDSTYQVDGRIKRVRKASYEETFKEVYLVNSLGLDLSYSKSFFSGSVIAVAEDRGDTQSGWDYVFSHFQSELDMEVLSKRAGKMATGMLGAEAFQSILCPIILRNVTSAQFLSLLASSFLGESVIKNKSILTGKVGKPIFSPLITVVDDALLQEGASAAPFDGEGVISQGTKLVDEGRLQGYLYDLFWAAKAGVSSTANSRRAAASSQPTVGITNLCIKAGEKSPEDLIGGVDKGVYINDVMGLHTADPVSGDFSVGANGYYIEGGRILYPIKEFVLSGNIIELFKKVTGVGDDMRFVGPVGSPSILIDNMDISGGSV